MELNLLKLVVALLVVFSSYFINRIPQILAQNLVSALIDAGISRFMIVH